MPMMRATSPVSIHASSREDATRKVWRLPASMGFNPRVLAGGRDNAKTATHRNGTFQSTRPRGRTRREHLAHKVSEPGFNPRVLAGGRDKRFEEQIVHKRFQSTRPRGRTRRSRVVNLPVSSSFQSTRPRGRTRQDNTMFDKAFCVSIHASSREDATILAFHFHCRTCFNPRVLAGGRDLAFMPIRSMRLRFNPRVLAGGRD